MEEMELPLLPTGCPKIREWYNQNFKETNIPKKGNL